MFEPLESRRLLSGVTLITHGQGGSAGGDVARTADLIAGRAGGAAQYVMTVAERSGDVVVLMSNGGFGGIHQKLLRALA